MYNIYIAPLTQTHIEHPCHLYLHYISNESNQHILIHHLELLFITVHLTKQHAHTHKTLLINIKRTLTTCPVLSRKKKNKQSTIIAASPCLPNDVPINQLVGTMVLHQLISSLIFNETFSSFKSVPSLLFAC